MRSFIFVALMFSPWALADCVEAYQEAEQACQQVMPEDEFNANGSAEAFQQIFISAQRTYLRVADIHANCSQALADCEQSCSRHEHMAFAYTGNKIQEGYYRGLKEACAGPGQALPQHRENLERLKAQTFDFCRTAQANYLRTLSAEGRAPAQVINASMNADSFGGRGCAGELTAPMDFQIERAQGYIQNL